MQEQQFSALYRATWDAFREHIPALAKQRHPANSNSADFPYLYRQLCQHLALARGRHYSPALIEELQNLVHEGHQLLYRQHTAIWPRLMRFVLVDFPCRVRVEYKAVGLAAALIFGPILLLVLALHFHPDWAYYLLPGETLHDMEKMYPVGAESAGFPRPAEDDFYMWGYYIFNNVRIDFQCFAGGILFGVGSLFFLLYNGITIGTVAGHLTQLGAGIAFWSFVAGHSAFELIGAVLSGAAGLVLGGALVYSGQQTRLASLRQRMPAAIELLAGAACMTFTAAFIEAFWSSQVWVIPPVKYALGITLFALLLAYFLVVGRQRAP